MTHLILAFGASTGDRPVVLARVLTAVALASAMLPQLGHAQSSLPPPVRQSLASTGPAPSQPAPPPPATPGIESGPALQPPATQPGDDPGQRALEQRAALLQENLEELARIGSTSQVVGSIGGIVVGGLTAAYGVSVAVNGTELGQTGGRAGLSGVALAGGALMIARAVYSLVAGENRDRDRLVRFQRLSAQGRADGEALARFEGELAAEADASRAARISGGVSALAVAASGGALLGFGASSKLEGRAETAAYIFGGTLLGLGLLQSVSSLLLSSTHERVWQHYEGMRMAQDSSLVRISLAPVVGPRQLALGVNGTF